MQPTDSTLPSFKLRHAAGNAESATYRKTADTFKKLDALGQKYEKLRQMERDVDWNLTRGIVDMKDKLSELYIPGVPTGVRVYVRVVPEGQAWQESSVNPAKEPLDYVGRSNFPRATIEVYAKVVSADAGLQGLVLSDLFGRVVIETDHDTSLYRGGATLFDWRETPGEKAAGVKVTVNGTENFKVNVLLFRKSTPEVVQVHPALGSIIDCEEGDRIYITRALWLYIKTHGLQDAERRQIRTDATLAQIFNNQPYVPFHHVPEYVKKFLLPAKPLVVTHDVDLSRDTPIRAFDMTIMLPDPHTAAMKERIQELTTYQVGDPAIIALDERISSTVADIRAALVQTSFLASFASDPVQFINRWVDSQARDLSLILSENPVLEGALGGGPVSAEDLRRHEAWDGAWVDAAAKLYANR